MPTTKRKKPPARKRPVQVSMDQSLLKEIDADEESKKLGRSAFIARAVINYLRQKREREVDARLMAAY